MFLILKKKFYTDVLIIYGIKLSKILWVFKKSLEKFAKHPF